MYFWLILKRVSPCCTLYSVNWTMLGVSEEAFCCLTSLVPKTCPELETSLLLEITNRAALTVNITAKIRQITAANFKIWFWEYPLPTPNLRRGESSNFLFLKAMFLAVLRLKITANFISAAFRINFTTTV